MGGWGGDWGGEGTGGEGTGGRWGDIREQNLLMAADSKMKGSLETKRQARMFKD